MASLRYAPPHTQQCAVGTPRTAAWLIWLVAATSASPHSGAWGSARPGKAWQNHAASCTHARTGAYGSVTHRYATGVPVCAHAMIG